MHADVCACLSGCSRLRAQALTLTRPITVPHSVSTFVRFPHRYRNEGARIDYILCDAPLWDQFGMVGGELDGYVKNHIDTVPTDESVRTDFTTRLDNRNHDLLTSNASSMRRSRNAERRASLNACVNFGAFQQGL